MRIKRVEIQNFRGIANGTISFSGHTLIVGPNNACKSTVLEAIDLVLGPERGSGGQAIDEHDFHRGLYRPPASALVEGVAAVEQPTTSAPERMPIDVALEENKAKKISVIIVLDELSEGEMTDFRTHVQPWKESEMRAYEPEELASYSPMLNEYVLRLQFHGWYDHEDDEFKTETVFLWPPPSTVDGSYDHVGKRQKQLIGFLYLRALRTGRRAVSLHRGSLLDVFLNAAGAKMDAWHEILQHLDGLGDAVSVKSKLKEALGELESAVGKYLPRNESGSGSRLHVTNLTREHLRTVMTYFSTSRESGHLLPFDRMGSGMTNILVLALLSLIAERKRNVIFAMEEPEVALGPTVQRRIISNLKSVAQQALVTSHSPYVAEQFLPDQIVAVRRRPDQSLAGTRVIPPNDLKEKILRRDFRLRFAEGLVANVVVIVEGVTEVYALPTASDVLAGVKDTAYRGLDLLGVVPVRADGTGEIEKVAGYFHGAGIPTYVFCDKLSDNTMRTRIKAVADGFEEHPYPGFENLVAEELAIDVLKRTLTALVARADFPSKLKLPEATASEKEWRDRMYDVLHCRKNEAYAALVLQQCTEVEMPATLRKYFGELNRQITGVDLPAGDPLLAILS